MTPGLLQLRRDERGQILPILLFTILWIWACSVMVWNTGSMVTTKVRLQTAADTAAYSAATTMSRTTNVVTGLNKVMVRGSSAQALCYAAPMASAAIIANWAAAASNPFNWPQLAVEVPIGVRAMARPVATGVREIFSQRLDNRVEEIFRFQQSVVASCPDAVEANRRQLERYFDCQILLSQPGGFSAGPTRGRRGQARPVLAPVREARRWNDLAASAANLGLRLLQDGKGISDKLKPVKLGQGQASWWSSVLLFGAFVNVWAWGDDFHVITTNRILEYRPTAQERINDFSVIALATDPGPKRDLVMPGLFGRGVNPANRVVAYAQGETFNGLDIAGWDRRPWRVWTLSGWHWQPRLALSDGLESAFTLDKPMRDLLGAVQVRQADMGDAQRAVTH